MFVPDFDCSMPNVLLPFMQEACSALAIPYICPIMKSRNYIPETVFPILPQNIAALLPNARSYSGVARGTDLSARLTAHRDHDSTAVFSCEYDIG